MLKNHDQHTVLVGDGLASRFTNFQSIVCVVIFRIGKHNNTSLCS